MKGKIIVITSENKQENIFDELVKVGVSPFSIKILCCKAASKNYTEILNKIRKNRPCMVVLDGKIRQNRLVELRDNILITLKINNIDGSLYLIKEENEIPGIPSIKMEEIENILNKKITL